MAEQRPEIMDVSMGGKYIFNFHDICLFYQKTMYMMSNDIISNTRSWNF